MPPFSVFLLLQPQVLCSLPRAALRYPSRLTLFRWHEKSSTMKMEGNFNYFKVGGVKFHVTHSVPPASNLVVRMALEQMIEVKSSLCTPRTFTHGAIANILPYSHSFPNLVLAWEMCLPIPLHSQGNWVQQWLPPNKLSKVQKEEKYNRKAHSTRFILETIA